MCNIAIFNVRIGYGFQALIDWFWYSEFYTIATDGNKPISSTYTSSICNQVQGRTLLISALYFEHDKNIC